MAPKKTKFLIQFHKAKLNKSKRKKKFRLLKKKLKLKLKKFQKLRTLIRNRKCNNIKFRSFKTKAEITADGRNIGRKKCRKKWPSLSTRELNL